MAKTLSRDTSPEAEAVQLAILRDMGCHDVQGYLCSRPVPADELAKLVARGVLLDGQVLAAPALAFH